MLVVSAWVPIVHCWPVIGHLGEHLQSTDAGSGGGLEDSNEFPNNKKRNTDYDYTTALTPQQQQRQAVWRTEIKPHVNVQSFSN